MKSARHQLQQAEIRNIHEMMNPRAAIKMRQAALMCHKANS
jgi:hypothetical protein